MKKIHLIVLFLISFGNVANAQFDVLTKADAESVKKIPLLVVIKEKDIKTIEKLSKKGKEEELKKYVSEIDSYNSIIKTGFERDWNFSKEIRFINKDELENIQKDKKNKGKFCVFQQNIRNVGMGMNNFDKTIYFSLDILGYKTISPGMGSVEINPNEAEIKYMIQICQGLLIYYGSEEKTKEVIKKDREIFKQKVAILKDKVLFLSKDCLSKDLLKEIGNVYKYKYKIVDQEEIDNAIMKNDPTVVYNRYSPFFALIDASNGRYLF